jgi:hypothetical protein
MNSHYFTKEIQYEKQLTLLLLTIRNFNKKFINHLSITLSIK